MAPRVPPTAVQSHARMTSRRNRSLLGCSAASLRYDPAGCTRAHRAACAHIEGIPQAAKPPRARRSGRRGVTSSSRAGVQSMRHTTSTSALPRATSFKAPKGMSKSASAATVVGGGSTAPAVPHLPEPRVFVPHEQPPGAVPRQVQVERKKRHYAEQDIAKLLELGGVPDLKVRPQPAPDINECWALRARLTVYVSDVTTASGSNVQQPNAGQAPTA